MKLAGVIVVIVFVAFALACGGSPKKPARAVVTENTADRERPATGEQHAGDMTVTTDTGDDLSWLSAVYFELDSSELLPATRDTLARLHDWLAARPAVKLVTIEGHCDEQGTTEYNVALGQRRAQALVDYLVRLGTASGRLNPISYGDVRPADDGHDEVAWSKNRRGEFRVDEPRR